MPENANTKSIWKYPAPSGLEAERQVEYNTPIAARIIGINQETGDVYCEVYPSAAKGSRLLLKVFGTGDQIAPADISAMQYIGLYREDPGYIWHVYGRLV